MLKLFLPLLAFVVVICFANLHKFIVIKSHKFANIIACRHIKIGVFDVFFQLRNSFLLSNRHEFIFALVLFGKTASKFLISLSIPPCILANHNNSDSNHKTQINKRNHTINHQAFTSTPLATSPLLLVGLLCYKAVISRSLQDLVRHNNKTSLILYKSKFVFIAIQAKFQNLKLSLRQSLV